VNRPEMPESTKMLQVNNVSQAIGEFLDWCSEQGWHLAEHAQFAELRDPILVPLRISTQEVLARHFDIDLNKVELEKRALLEWIRQQDGKAVSDG
jgi:hypothetical protein